MELFEEVAIDASPKQVFAALNNLDILKQCIPGCQDLQRLSDGELEAKVVLKIGPVKARFSGTVTLDQSGAPGSFSLSGHGSGGIAGHVRGGAQVSLAPDGLNRTILRYTARAEVGGKLAQLGSRLVQSTARKLSAQFFETFSVVTGREKIG
ncbi:MAG: carbon monoxide dehydrogenase [Mesorhizobium sp.]|uniref:CoxG family protein n=1 Tax=Mesorhizobium sp. TaxID=1871066 RepID=UPI000FE4687C|nr:carbon monoxide dehydrogenase subunit G [Mesorhizobium sp.]RWI57121.1 MAG: carbon monoxide dehydrogenase [Mesorhizobium sp.]